MNKDDLEEFLTNVRIYICIIYESVVNKSQRRS